MTTSDREMYNQSDRLLYPEELSEDEAHKILTELGFSDTNVARKRFLNMCDSEKSREELSRSIPVLLVSLSNAAIPDNSLLNFERFVQCVEDRTELFQYLAENLRAVEILIKLFVGSQFLTEILLRNPGYLKELTQNKRLSDFKSQDEYHHESLARTVDIETLENKLAEVHHYHHWELLRIGACDSFGLMDLKTITLQLSLLADGIVRTSLKLLSDHMDLDASGFAILAFGKLGGEEINYSSDIDLVFISRDNASQFWPLGQKLIKVLMESTPHGFFYRVDMRLRPWGRSGALVTTVDAYLDYLKKDGMLWEKQALIKARGIAGDLSVANDFLKQVQPIIYNCSPEEARINVLQMKSKIEAGLERKKRNWGEVKAGVGSIRDVEFVTQYLQIANGSENPGVRSINTLDALIRLAEHSFIQADEYRQLSSGYVFLRIIEHALQLMHYKQIHNLPSDKRELAFLARRLDFPDVETFVSAYERHCSEIRKVYQKYIEGTKVKSTESKVMQTFSERLSALVPTYKERYTDDELEFHEKLYSKLSDDQLTILEAERLEIEDEKSDTENSTFPKFKLTIAGYDYLGLTPLISGLLFSYGYNILSGDIFTGETLVDDDENSISHQGRTRRFICVLQVQSSVAMVPSEVWIRYRADLEQLTQLLISGNSVECYGELAGRVANALMESNEPNIQLYPVEINIDNNISQSATLLEIRSADTPGFLYELGNGLALQGIQIDRLIVNNIGNKVADTLFVKGKDGNKIEDPKKLQEIKAAIVLIKHFSHLLPNSPNPESALLHFRDFLEKLFEQDDWIDDITQLEQSPVLEAMAKLLGVSDFLWEDFLKLQHSNLFPVVTDINSLSTLKSAKEMRKELESELQDSTDLNQKIEIINAFKDREMLRIDLRHILGYQKKFGQFSLELTNVAEIVTDVSYHIHNKILQERYGQPCPVSICALGKCGGKELGFASDIELMFIYESNEMTTGDEPITNGEYYQKLVEQFQKTIRAKRAGIFQIDLRLRPYGKAGSLAVSLDAFQKYFSPDGPAWPYERQALVKLRPIAGDTELGKKIVQVRDKMIYTGQPFDVTAMRGMRERQIRQLVKAGTLNAKLSLGGLVDCEYFVQGLQITYGHLSEDLRSTNTREALKSLEQAKIIPPLNRIALRDSYRFLRRLIDALRMVRGDARDLTIPDPDSKEFEFLARRLDYRKNYRKLVSEIEIAMANVQNCSHLLENACLNSKAKMKK